MRKIMISTFLVTVLMFMVTQVNAGYVVPIKNDSKVTMKVEVYDPTSKCFDKDYPDLYHWANIGKVKKVYTSIMKTDCAPEKTFKLMKGKSRNVATKRLIVVKIEGGDQKEAYNLLKPNHKVSLKTGKSLLHGIRVKISQKRK